MDFLVVEAEGLPDIAGGRQVYGLASDLADKDVAKVIFHHHLHSGGGTPFLPPPLRAVAAVSLIRCRESRLERRDLSAAGQGESALLHELARAVARHQGTCLVWDGGRHVGTWLAVRALVHREVWGRPVLRRIDAESGLADARVSRHQLAARLEIRCTAVPDDESNWQEFRQSGEARLVERGAVDAAATAALWLRQCLAANAITQDEHEALADQLLRIAPPGMTAAA